MADPHNIRRLAFQTLFQLDCRGEQDALDVQAALAGAEGFTDAERESAFKLAVAAYQHRAASDEEINQLAPTWPTNRQAAVDRAILRLAHYEITSGRTAPVVAVNEAVELAKEFSTEKSPGFVNALLDKVLHRVGEVKQEEPGDAQSAETRGEENPS